MLNWFPRSILGGVLALLYLIFAIAVVVADRRAKSGDWISLHGMATFLVTFPVSAPSEMLGFKLNFRRNVDVIFAILPCMLLVYMIGASMGKVVTMLWTMMRH